MIKPGRPFWLLDTTVIVAAPQHWNAFMLSSVCEQSSPSTQWLTRYRNPVAVASSEIPQRCHHHVGPGVCDFYLQNLQLVFWVENIVLAGRLTVCVLLFCFCCTCVYIFFFIALPKHHTRIKRSMVGSVWVTSSGISGAFILLRVCIVKQFSVKQGMLTVKALRIYK